MDGSQLSPASQLIGACTTSSQKSRRFHYESKTQSAHLTSAAVQCDMVYLVTRYKSPHRTTGPPPTLWERARRRRGAGAEGTARGLTDTEEMSALGDGGWMGGAVSAFDGRLAGALGRTTAPLHTMCAGVSCRRVSAVPARAAAREDRRYGEVPWRRPLRSRPAACCGRQPFPRGVAAAAHAVWTLCGDSDLRYTAIHIMITSLLYDSHIISKLSKCSKRCDKMLVGIGKFM